jgi:hypothetical protein
MNSVINKSSYFQNMTPADLVARDTMSIANYIDKYKKSLLKFTNHEKTKLNNLISGIDNVIIKYKNISNIPWKIAKISNDIELSFPHTLEDVIIISAKFFEMPIERQKITLLHEKIHIYQRLFPLETEELIINVLKYEIKKENSDYRLLRRNNPDLNNLVYGKDNYYTVQLYNSFHPDSIADSRVFKIIGNKKELIEESNSDIQIEHPYEIMASYLPKVIFKQLFDIKIEDWLNNYL